MRSRGPRASGDAAPAAAPAERTAFDSNHTAPADAHGSPTRAGAGKHEATVIMQSTFGEELEKIYDNDPISVVQTADQLKAVGHGFQALQQGFQLFWERLLVLAGVCCGRPRITRKPLNDWSAICLVSIQSDLSNSWMG